MGAVLFSSAQKSESKIRLIVNADDFGMSPGVTEGVLEAFHRGIVRGASLMVTSAYAEDAARQARQAGIDVGLHFNLSTGRPVCRAVDVPSLVRTDGAFYSLGELVWRLSSGLVRPADVGRELRAQIVRARALGLHLSHVNGHHHVQIHPAVAAPLVHVAATEKLGVRCPVEPIRPAAPRDLARTAFVSAPSLWLKRQVRRAGVRTSQHFRGLALGYGFSAAALADTLRELRPGVTELMCHPGHPDAALAEATLFTMGRERELAALTDSGIRRLAEALGIKPVSWAEVVRS